MTMPELMCPYCHEDRLIEVLRPYVVCMVCGKSWPAEPERAAGPASTPDARRESGSPAIPPKDGA